MNRITGEELKHRRIAAGISRGQLARPLGVTAEKVLQWESGEKPIEVPSALEQALEQFEEVAEHLPATLVAATRSDSRLAGR
ncbi:MAG: helix-turn-helix transcriptional regulator [Thermoanaerobaculia bacterium]